MTKDQILDMISVLESFLGHRGWTDYGRKKLLMREAAAMHELLQDVGDTKSRADFLRGRITAYQDVLKMFSTDLNDLKLRLEEAQVEGPAPEPIESEPLPPI